MNDLPVYQLEYGEVGTFGKNVVTIVKTKAPEGESDLIALSERLDNSVTTLEEKSGVKHSDNEMDAAVTAADKKRDDTVIKICRHLRGCLDNLESGVAVSANYVLDVLMQQGNDIANLSQEKETHALYVALNELKKDKYKTHLELTKTADSFVQLDGENKDFESVYNKRNSMNTGSSDSTPTFYVNEVRKEITRVINYLDTIEVLRAEKLKPVIDEINAAISVLAPKVQARKTRSENDKKKNSELETAK